MTERSRSIPNDDVITAAVDPTPGFDYVRYYAIHITASQFLDKPRDASASVALGRNCKFAAISCYISETVQGINLAPKYLVQNANMKSYVIYRLVSLTLSDP